MSKNKKKGLVGISFAFVVSACSLIHEYPVDSVVFPVVSVIDDGNYSRKSFKHWVDYDRDCQDERAEFLISKSSAEVTFLNNKRCTVDSGLWTGYYSGHVITKASAIDIDHIVPLKEVYLSGGKRWSSDRKKEYANNHKNLVISLKSLNRSKSSSDIGGWLPPNADSHCKYKDDFLRVKKLYGLSIDSNELFSIGELNKSCGNSAISKFIFGLIGFFVEEYAVNSP